MELEMFYETLVPSATGDRTRQTLASNCIFSQGFKWDHRTVSGCMNLRVRDLFSLHSGERQHAERGRCRGQMGRSRETMLPQGGEKIAAWVTDEFPVPGPPPLPWSLAVLLSLGTVKPPESLPQTLIPFFGVNFNVVFSTYKPKKFDFKNLKNEKVM